MAEDRIEEADAAGNAAWAEWLAGFVVGCIPLLAHATTWWTEKPPAAPRWQEWCAELLFVSIVTSGTAIITTVAQVVRLPAVAQHFRGRAIILILFSLICFVIGALAYGQMGNPAADQDHGLDCALGLLVGALMGSFALELLVTAILRYEATLV